MLCTNKIRVIYFCPNWVNFMPENTHFFFLGGGSDFPLTTPPLPQLEYLCLVITYLLVSPTSLEFICEMTLCSDVGKRQPSEYDVI